MCSSGGAGALEVSASTRVPCATSSLSMVFLSCCWNSPASMLLSEEEEEEEEEEVGEEDADACLRFPSVFPSSMR